MDISCIPGIGIVRTTFLRNYLGWSSTSDIQKKSEKFPYDEVLLAAQTFENDHPFSSLKVAALIKVAERVWIIAKQKNISITIIHDEKDSDLISLWKRPETQNRIEEISKTIKIPKVVAENVKAAFFYRFSEQRKEIFAENLFCCSICGDEFLTPCCLPSGYSYCFSCLLSDSKFGSQCHDALTAEYLEWDRVSYNRALDSIIISRLQIKTKEGEEQELLQNIEKMDLKSEEVVFKIPHSTPLSSSSSFKPNIAPLTDVIEDANVQIWMKKTFEKFKAKGNYDGTPDNGDGIEHFFYNLKMKSVDINVIPKSSYWHKDDQLYFIHWTKFIVAFQLDGIGEIASRPGPILHSFKSFDEVIEHIDKNVDVYSLKKEA